MNSSPSPVGALTLGHVLQVAGVSDANEAIAIRHTVRPNDPKSLRDMTEEGILAYTRVHTVRTNIFPKEPPAVWLVFLAEGARGTRSRFYTAYENHGEVLAERTDDLRSYDLLPSVLLEKLRGRLLVDWGAGAIGWAKRRAKAAALPVIEIADPTVVPFPGYGGVLLTLRRVAQSCG